MVQKLYLISRKGTDKKLAHLGSVMPNSGKGSSGSVSQFLVRMVPSAIAFLTI